MTIADVPVALLAGGLATRLRPITTKVPKALVEVAGRPFIDHQLALLRRHGVRRVVACVGHLGEQIEAHVAGGSGHGLEVVISYDGPDLLGTGGALRKAMPLLGEVFWVLYGDSYLDFDYAAALETFVRQDALGLMTVLRNDDRWDRSNLVFRGRKLLCYSKQRHTPEMTHIDYGASLLRREALQRIPPATKCDLVDLYSELVAEGRMAAHEVTHRFYEIGSPQGLADTEEHIRRFEAGQRPA
jgi:NDP-sugar pyrophosphorylase family protein